MKKIPVVHGTDLRGATCFQTKIMVVKEDRPGPLTIFKVGYPEKLEGAAVLSYDLRKDSYEVQLLSGTEVCVEIIKGLCVGQFWLEEQSWVEENLRLLTKEEMSENFRRKDKHG